MHPFLDTSRFIPVPALYIYVFVHNFIRGFFSIGGINALKIMIGSVYFWAGFHKLNMTFFSTIFPWFVEPLYKISYDSGPIGSFITLIVFSVPIFEASIGILLLFYPEKWKFASIMAFIMLATVMICLGPLGHNWNQSVWPWNIYLFLVEYSLFYKLKGDGQRVLLERNLATILSITLFSFAPALPLVGLGHSYPAFKLYSGNTKYAEVVFSNSETLAALPEGIKKLVMNNHGTLPLVEWTVYESNVATYPESYVYKKGAKGLCPYLTDKDGAILRIYSPPHFYSLSPTHEDFPLCQDVSIEQTGNNSNALKP
jgi:hypothetical protein